MCWKGCRGGSQAFELEVQLPFWDIWIGKSYGRMGVQKSFPVFYRTLSAALPLPYNTQMFISHTFKWIELVPVAPVQNMRKRDCDIFGQLFWYSFLSHFFSRHCYIIVCPYFYDSLCQIDEITLISSVDHSDHIRWYYMGYGLWVVARTKPRNLASTNKAPSSKETAPMTI